MTQTTGRYTTTNWIPKSLQKWRDFYAVFPCYHCAFFGSIHLPDPCNTEESAAVRKAAFGTGIDLSAGELVSTYDDHGFHGDGTTCTIIQFSDDALLEEIEAAGTWQAFPPDEAVNQLLYGNYLDDPETQEPFVPPIEKGYYLLKDRNSQAAEKPNIMKRGSFNFDLAVYDADNHTLYYLVLDT